MCREYMVRLEKSDFDDQKRLSRLARVAASTPEEFRTQFGYLADVDLGQTAVPGPPTEQPDLEVGDEPSENESTRSGSKKKEKKKEQEV